MKFGLCCKFVEEPIKFKTTTVKACSSLSYSQRINKLSTLILHNLKSLYKSINYCCNNNISSYRIGSDLLPLFDHPEFKYSLRELNEPELFIWINKIQELIKTTNIRLTIHPSQYTVINSPKQDVVDNSFKVLEYHDYLCDLFYIDTIIIHVGGVYGNRPEAIERFITNFNRLSDSIKSRLVVENDDKSYSVSDVKHISGCCKIPFVYDVHHDRCLEKECDILTNTLECLESWSKFRKDLKPVFHISSPFSHISDKEFRKHHDYINIVDFPECWKELDDVIIEVEAKHKELAIEKLQKDLNCENS